MALDAGLCCNGHGLLCNPVARLYNACFQEEVLPFNQVMETDFTTSRLCLEKRSRWHQSTITCMTKLASASR